jgi:hypothetical protein
VLEAAAAAEIPEERQAAVVALVVVVSWLERKGLQIQAAVVVAVAPHQATEVTAALV